MKIHFGENPQTRCWHRTIRERQGGGRSRKVRGLSSNLHAPPKNPLSNSGYKHTSLVHLADETSQFDGWGYVHLFDAATLEDLDTFAIPEAMDPAFASGYGDLSVHEVATDPTDPSLAYLSYYSGGLRAIQIQCGGAPYDPQNPPADTSTCELVEVGGYLDPLGNDFWGVEVVANPDDDPNVEGDEVLSLASDRDYGLFIFRDP